MVLLETDRLFLRDWVPDDWKRYKPLATDPRVLQYIGRGEPPTDERVKQFVCGGIEKSKIRGWILWPVVHRQDAELIGFCGFADGFPPDVEIGWRLRPEYWGQGFATEIARAVMQYGWQRFGFARLIAVIQPTNRASLRVAEKLGMTFDARFMHHGIELLRYAKANPGLGQSDATKMNYRFATFDDIAVLAPMNQQLIQDEGHRNPMTVDGLEDRMRSWLQTEYRAILFEEGSEALGYALFKQDPDWIYLRQFFVCRERRRQGIGRNAMRWLLANVWNDAERVRLDVLIGNSAAIQFWQSVGFAGYCVTMER